MKNKEERFSATISELRQDNTCVQERLVKEESEKLVNFQFVTFCCDIFFLFLHLHLLLLVFFFLLILILFFFCK
jgi:hypothetical protein